MKKEEFWSPHFTIEELTVSPMAVRLGIENEPDERAIDCLQALSENVLEPLRVCWVADHRQQRLPLAATEQGRGWRAQLAAPAGAGGRHPMSG